MWMCAVLLFILGLVAEFSDAQLVTHEGGTIIATCYVSLSTRKTSPVYWYSFKFSAYLTEDYRVTVTTNLTTNLLNRLSVIGDGGHYNMKITNVTNEDAGDYQCGYYETTNKWITKETANVFVHAPIPPEPGYPLCATEPSDQLHPDMPVKLSCISRGGSPPASLTWYRDGIPLQTTNTEFEGYHQRTLTPEDNGVRFVCKSTSPGFDSTKECSVTPLRLTPQVRIYESHNPVKIGEEVKFKCVGEGVPSVVSYLWYWNGELITEQFSDRLIISGDNREILTLSSVHQHENGSLFRCDVETVNGLRNTDQLRLRVMPNILPGIPTTTKQGAGVSFAPVIEPQDDSGLSFGVVFGCILAGIVIALIVLGIVKYTSRYRKRHHRKLDFNPISFNHLNNCRHQNVEELSRLNQTHNNKTCNLGVIDLAAATASDTDYDLINDNETKKASVQSNDKQITEHYATPDKQMEEHYANPDFKDNTESDCQTYHTVNSGSAAKELSVATNMDQRDQVNPLYAATGGAIDLSEYDFPDFNVNPRKSQRIRSQSVANQGYMNACHYQRPPRRMMPKICENSNKAPLQRKVLARSLPDLTPSTGLISVPIDIDHHDYVNMNVAISPTVSPITGAPDYHDYVNYTHDMDNRRNPVARSDSSSSGYCEEPESPRLLPAVSPSKKLRYAELDFPEYSDLNDMNDANSSSSTENILQYSQIPSLEGSLETCPLSPTSYAKIAYVFKDRRQQSEPTVPVQRISVTSR